jgi:hypothetical protein
MNQLVETFWTTNKVIIESPVAKNELKIKNSFPTHNSSNHRQSKTQKIIYEKTNLKKLFDNKVDQSIGTILIF